MRLAGGPAPQWDGPGLWLQQTAGCGLHPPDRYVSSQSVSAHYSRKGRIVKGVDDVRFRQHVIADNDLITIVLSTHRPQR